MAVRRALPADVPAIAAAHVASWEGTYRGLLPDRVIDDRDVERRTLQWRSFFDVERERHVLAVAEHPSVVGFSHAGPTRDDDLNAATTGEIRAIYVDPAHWGHGHGRDLMVASLRFLREAGFDSASLWVLVTNALGRSFYEAGGWRVDGATKTDTSMGAPIDEVRYRIGLK